MVREQKKMRMIALRGLTVLPHTMVHLDISRKLSLETANQAMNEDQMIFLVCQKDKEMMHPEQKDLYQVGTVAKIRQIVKIPAGPVRVLVEGLERARLEHMEEENSCLIAEIRLMEEEEDGDKLAEEAEDSRTQIQRFIRLTELNDTLKNKVNDEIIGIRAGVELSYINPEEQIIINDIIDEANIKLSTAQAQKLRAVKGTITKENVLEIIKGKPKKNNQDKFTGKLQKNIWKKYKDKFANDKEFSELIDFLLENYYKNLSDERRTK